MQAGTCQISKEGAECGKIRYKAKKYNLTTLRSILFSHWFVVPKEGKLFYIKLYQVRYDVTALCDLF